MDLTQIIQKNIIITKIKDKVDLFEGCDVFLLSFEVNNENVPIYSEEN